ncbi:MAG TPA: class II aldolase/adducin family protein [Casimicrobiaceae bacterium]|nr:class II aldolase/adducin family protein [Casimicrobiaceae bacterium]
MSASSPEELLLRKGVIAAARGMNACGINRGRSGNVSARLQGGSFVITPTGMPYESLAPEDLVALEPQGRPRDAHGRRPSSEWPLHAAIYAARADAGAIVHTHSVFATTLACLHRGIPEFHYMIALAGGEIRCAPYALFGSAELADGAVQALHGRKACLLAHHGLVVLSTDPENALELALQVETLAEIYWRALQIAEPKLLSSSEMSFVSDKFITYGQQS